MNSNKTFELCQVNMLNNGAEMLDRYKLFGEALEEKEFDIITLQEVSDVENMKITLNNAGFEHIVFSDSILFDIPDKRSHLAIASKHPFSDLAEVDLKVNTASYTLLTAQVNINGQLVNVFSSHMPWGSFNEGSRLKVAEDINELAGRISKVFPDSISVLGGDLNAEPESRTVRYLTGNDLASDNLSSTLWVDAYATVGNESNYTTTDHAENFYGRRTALSVGVLYPDYIPQRRIDYIMTYGWAYGRLGCPIEFGYFEHPNGKVFSDHNSISAKLILN